MIRDAEDIILADGELTDAEKVLELALWRLGHGAPSSQLVTKLALAQLVGKKDVRSVEGPLKRLAVLERISIRLWDKSRGTIVLDVWHPAPGKREARVDPQRRLDLGVENFAQTFPGEGSTAALLENSAQTFPGEGSTAALLENSAQTFPSTPMGSSLLAGARVRLSSCLVFLSSSTTQGEGIRGEVLARAEEIYQAIFSHRPGTKLDLETRKFILTVAAAAVLLAGEFPEFCEWIAYSVSATARAKAERPGAHLQVTLREFPD